MTNDLSLLSKLALSRDVALAGSDASYWDAKILFDALGLSDIPFARTILDGLLSRAMAFSVESSDLSERAFSTLPPGSVYVIRPARPQEHPANQSTADEGLPEAHLSSAVEDSAGDRA